MNGRFCVAFSFGAESTLLYSTYDTANQEIRNKKKEPGGVVGYVCVCVCACVRVY